MILGSTTGDASTPGQGDQHFGGLAAIRDLDGAGVGRIYLMLVAKQAIRSGGSRQVRGSTCRPRAGWGLIGCTITMIGWLVAATWYRWRTVRCRCCCFGST